MKYLYFLFWKCEPNTAIFNRRWSLAKGIAESGIPVKAIFMLPNNGIECHEDCKNIECCYIGDAIKSKFNIVILLKSALWVVKNMKAGDSVLSLTILVALFNLLLRHKKCNIYTEYNEYPPLMYGHGIRGKFELNRFLSNTRKQKGIFVISKKIREYLINKAIDPEKVHVINMTVDSNRFMGIEKQKKVPYICYCGTVSNFKDGVNILLESFGLIANDVPNVKLYILGSQPYKKDNEINEAIIEKYGIHDRIFMSGAVPGNEMPQYLKNAEVLVLSRPDNIQAAYGFPTKLGE